MCDNCEQNKLGVFLLMNFEFIASALSEALRRKYPDTELASYGITADVLLTREDILRLLEAPFCEHGLPRVGDCKDCGMTATLAEMFQRICEAKLGDRMPDDDAWRLARESLRLKEQQ